MWHFWHGHGYKFDLLDYNLLEERTDFLVNLFTETNGHEKDKVSVKALGIIFFSNCSEWFYRPGQLHVLNNETIIFKFPC